jgi:hypothetical protein
MNVDQGLLNHTFDGEKEKGRARKRQTRVAYGPCWNKPMAEQNKEWVAVAWQGLLGLPADLLFARSYMRPMEKCFSDNIECGVPFRESLGGASDVFSHQ